MRRTRARARGARRAARIARGARQQHLYLFELLLEVIGRLRGLALPKPHLERCCLELLERLRELPTHVQIYLHTACVWRAVRAWRITIIRG